MGRVGTVVTDTPGSLTGCKPSQNRSCFGSLSRHFTWPGVQSPATLQKFSKRWHTLHQHIVLLCLKLRKNTTHRTLLDELIEMPRIRSAIELEELPSPSTLCKAFNRLNMAVWRVLLNLSVTLLVDTRSNAILD